MFGFIDNSVYCSSFNRNGCYLLILQEAWNFIFNNILKKINQITAHGRLLYSIVNLLRTVYF